MQPARNCPELAPYTNPVPLGGATGDAASFTATLARLVALAADTDSRHLADEVVATATALLDVDVAIARSRSRDGQSFVVVAAASSSSEATCDLFNTCQPVAHELEHMRAGSGLVINSFENERPDHFSAGELEWFEGLGLDQALIIPLLAGGNLVGRLDLIDSSDGPLRTRFKHEAALLAGLLAPLFRIDQLTDESLDTTIQREVFGLYQQIEQLADPRTILQAGVELLRREPGCDRAYAMLWNDERREFLPTAASGIEPRVVEMLKMISLSPQVVPAIDDMMTSGETVIVNNADTSKMLPRSLVDALGIQSAMFVPLRGQRHRTLGFLLLDFSSEGGLISRAAEQVMDGMAPALAMMIENAMLYEYVVASSDSLSVINEIGIQLAMLTDVESLFRQLHHQVGSVVDATYFALGLLDESRQEFDLRVAADEAIHRHRIHFSPGDDAISWAVQHGRSSNHGSRDAAAADQWAARIEGSQLCYSQMTVPISIGRNLVGAMTVRTPFRHAYDPHDLSVFSAIAVHTGVALDNARLYGIVEERGNRRAAVLDQVLQQQETERKELVEDIHDNTLQTLAACLYSLDSAHRLIVEKEDTEELISQIASVRTQLASNIDRLRKRIFAVRPATLDLLGIEPALTELVAAFQEQSEIEVHLDVQLPGRLSTTVETAVYRLIQDALSLHIAPERSGTLMVRARTTGGHISVTVAQAPDVARRSSAPVNATGEQDIAMLALIERTELLGGTLRNTGTREGGTSLQITLPLDAPRQPQNTPLVRSQRVKTEAAEYE